MLHGGIHQGSVCVVKGPPGSGKTTLGLHFLAEGVKEGENGLLVTFEHFPEQLYRDASSIGFDLEKWEKEGKVRVMFTSPEAFQTFLMEVDGDFDSMVLKSNLKRVFIDSISHFEKIIPEKRNLREEVYSLFNALKRHNLTTVVSQEDETLSGPLNLSPYGASYLVDTLIQLIFVEIESRLEKGVVIVKHRASPHDLEIKKLVISKEGAKVEEPFEGLEGIVSGSTHLTSPLKESLKVAKKLFE